MNTSTNATTRMTAARSTSRIWSQRTYRQVHWMSSAVCMLGIMLFAFTGITLNHADDLPGTTRIETHQASLPAPLLQQLSDLAAQASTEDSSPPLPQALRDWVDQTWSVSLTHASAEWSERELYLSMEEPGANSWLSIKLRSGAVTYQQTRHGAIAYLNDLHKGRHTGIAWSWFMDIFAAACLLFALTGLLLLKAQANLRPSTWPLVGVGIVVPLLIALFLLH